MARHLHHRHELRHEATCQSLEGRLDDVVGVAPTDHFDVHSDASRCSERRDNVLRKLWIECRVTERQTLRHVDVPLNVRTARKVESNVNQGLIERITAARKTPHAGFVTQSFGKTLPERNRHVFNRVMSVDMQITGSMHSEIKPTVATQLVKHVVVERDAS